MLKLFFSFSVSFFYFLPFSLSFFFFFFFFFLMTNTMSDKGHQDLVFVVQNKITIHKHLCEGSSKPHVFY